MTPFTKVDYEVALEIASHRAPGIQGQCQRLDMVSRADATGHVVERYIGKP